MYPHQYIKIYNIRTATKQSDPCAISTSCVLDALNSDKESSETSEVSESEYDNASEATSNPCHRMEADRIDQGT